MANIWNINFSNLNTSNDGGYYSATGKYTKLSNITDGVYTADGAGSTPALSINAVDIDWNGAVLPQSNISNGGSLTINNTGELLNLVNEMQKEIYVLSAAVIALSQTVQ